MTSLYTQLDKTGILLTDDQDRQQGRIAYNADMASPWHVVSAGADPNRWWSTREAAEFYALAVYADRQSGPDTRAEVEFHTNN